MNQKISLVGSAISADSQQPGNLHTHTSLSDGRHAPQEAIDDSGSRRSVTGFIFDMDETLSATSKLWHRAAADFLKIHGHKWSPRLIPYYAGMNVLDVASTLVQLLKIDVPLEECRAQIRELLIALFREESLTPMPGAEICLERTSKCGSLALASGSPMEAIEWVLKERNWERFFSVVISSESVPRGKPAPDVFLAAAKALDIPPAQCLVFEDSLVGVQAARAAGMRCFAVPASHPEEIAHIATRVFPSLGDISVSDWDFS